MNKITIKGAKHNNLKNLDIEIPHQKLIIISGVSGSGKSTLANDIIFKESERRFLETYSVYARQFLKKMQAINIDSIHGLQPAIRLEQKNYISSPRSTVGTQTNVYDLLRLLFARFGVSKNQPLNINRNLFSFNSPQGACKKCNGLRVIDKIDPELLIADTNKTLREGALKITTPSGYTVYSQVTIDVMDKVCQSEGFNVDIPWNKLTDYQKNIILNGSDKIKIPFGKHSLESRMKWKGITAKPREEGYYKGILPVMEEILKRDRNPNILRFVKTVDCDICFGSGLNYNALNVYFENKSIYDFAQLSIDEIYEYFNNYSSHNQSLNQITSEIVKKTDNLKKLGLEYLCLNRNSSSLSGGEAARLRLASQINSELSGLLYVMDEPSAGLHAADAENLLNQIRVLIKNGNTVIAVEHNDYFIRNADYLIDLGPKAGINGGELLINQEISENIDDSFKPITEKSETAKFILNKKSLKADHKKNNSNKHIEIINASSRNLKNINVKIPINQLSVVSGVSGAGKSSLIFYTLANYYHKIKNNNNIEYGKVKNIKGLEHFNQLIEINQKPIGKTPRSNPATYTKLFDEIRKLYSNLPEAKQNKLKSSHFSFNAKGGRCESCQGAGYIQVGMHFMGNIEVICKECNGKRFKKSILEIKYHNKNIFDVLNMSINEALVFFNNEFKILKYLQILSDLGLGYLKLGQRSSTLSGGEAQRIKLAAELSKKSSEKTLYLFDEPTKGLHLFDIQILLNAFSKLIELGNTIICIEHNLNFIKNADYIIDMGPKSGKNGGEIIFSGNANDLNKCSKSLTAKAILNQSQNKNKTSKNILKSNNSYIQLKGVTTNNLKQINTKIPKNKIIILTGVSGSGKSSFAYDTIYAESRNRYNQNYSAHFRTLLGNMEKAEYDKIKGLTPVIALNQKPINANEHSTVGTLTEIYTYFRLLYSRIAQLRFPNQTQNYTASHFSFNNINACCESCKGFGFKYIPDAEKIITQKNKSIINGALTGTKTGKFYGDPNGQYIAMLKSVGERKNIDYTKKWNELTNKEKDIAFNGCKNEIFEAEWNYKRGNRTGKHKFKGKWIGFGGHISEEFERKQADKRYKELIPIMKKEICEICNGQRLKKNTLNIKIDNKNISELSQLSVQKIFNFITNKSLKNNHENEIFKNITNSLKPKLKLMIKSGLGYLPINRLTASLSGGEAQRLRLASLAASCFTGITFVLDEPTIGLHPADTENLYDVINQSKSNNNTILIIEHDENFIKKADHIIEFGQGAGTNGGNIIAEGNIKSILQNPKSIIKNYLNKNIQAYRNKSQINEIALKIEKANANNLKNINVDIYKNSINVITGVSGSGKSSLLKNVILNSYKLQCNSYCKKIKGFEKFKKLIYVSQKAPNDSSISTPVTYLGLYDAIKNEFAGTNEFKESGLKKSAFLYNNKEGQCKNCKGMGIINISLDFLPDVKQICEVCNGNRFNNKILTLKLNQKNIADVLKMNFLEAKHFFNDNRKLVEKLDKAVALGLDYLQIGQSLNTLSGGEMQRLKLLKEMLKAKPTDNLFLFDEPSTGLHPKDIKKIIEVFDFLIKSGNTIIMVEHNITLIKNSDYIIDLGYEGGEKGGYLIANEALSDFLKHKESLTAKYLHKFLN